MMIDFTVANFCSIKEAQTFSLYAETPGIHLTNNMCYRLNDKLGNRSAPRTTPDRSSRPVRFLLRGV